MRGKENKFSYNDLSNGITPAYAGKSYNYGSERNLDRDHPRVCGEKTLVIWL